mgnify:CR=1 FL=1
MNLFTSILVISFLLVSTITNAAIVEYSFDATVSTVQGHASGAISAGDTVNATFRFDSDGSSSSNNSGIQEDYQFSDPATFDINFTVEHNNGSSIESYSASSSFGGISIINDWGANGDWFQFRTTPGSVASDPINGHSVSQIDMTLKNRDGSLYSDTSLPNQISELNNFDEAFFTIYLDGLFGFNANINKVKSTLSTPLVQGALKNLATELLSPSIEHNGAGGLVIDLPDTISDPIAVEAQFSQQSLSEFFNDPNPEFNFAIPGYSLDVGETLQTWDIHIDNNEIPNGELVELQLTYDDFGMSTFEELGLDVFHILDDGSLEVLQRTELNTDTNTITVLTPSFSNFGLMKGSSVPEPSILALMSFGLAGLGFAYRRKIKY